MSNEPTFPKEAAVGEEASPAPTSAPGTAAEPAGAQRKNRVRTGVAVGIGSAAIVAALMYANRGRRNDRGER